jgi:gluconokinase
MFEIRTPCKGMHDFMNGRDHIIALDMGTTSTKGLLYEIDGDIISSCSHGYHTSFPAAGRAEQDPADVLTAVILVVGDLVRDAGLKPQSVRALAFGGILHSLIPVRKDGTPMSRALIWSDMRAADQCSRLRRRLDGTEIRRRTGCPLHPLYYPARLLWFAEEAPDQFHSTIRYISIKEFVLAELYGEYRIDRSIASGTGLMNNATLDWDEELLHEIGINRSQLSSIVDTGYCLKGLRAEYAGRMGISPDTPAVIGAADGPLAHLGSAGVDASRMSLTVGTSAALRKMVPGPMLPPDCEAWCYYLAEGLWLQGGVVHDAGNVLQWFSEQVFETEGGVEKMYVALDRALRHIPPGSDGLFFLPFMSGQRSPFFNPRARTAMVGMSFTHGKEHMLRAIVEGISSRIYSVCSILDPGGAVELVVTGGILQSESWLRITADYLGRRLNRAGVRLASAWGATLIALHALGISDSLMALEGLVAPGEPVDYDEARHRAYRSIQLEYEELYRRICT